VIEFRPIGAIHSPFTDVKNMPIQPPGAQGVAGVVLLHSQYAEGVCDLEGFSHIILLYLFHRARDYMPRVTPFMDSTPRGLFSTRAPNRPNPIGLSVVELLYIDGMSLHIKGVDVLDGTPLLDIKPYVRKFDSPIGPTRTGWLGKSEASVSEKRSDDRFV